LSFDGEHYTIRNLNGYPKPVQPPHPPVIIGGGGPRMLGIAARQADIVGVNPTLHAGVIDDRAVATMTAEATAEKVQIVAAAAAAAGRLDTIEMNVRTFFVSVTDDRDAQIAGMAAMIGAPPEVVESSPFALIGSPPQIVETLLERREQYGFSYVVVGGAELDDFAPVVAELAGK